MEEVRQRRKLQLAARYLTDMRKKTGLSQAEVAEAMGVSQQRVSDTPPLETREDSVPSPHPDYADLPKNYTPITGSSRRQIGITRRSA